MKNILWLLAIVFCFVSCNRNKGEGLTTVEGILVDEINGTPQKNCEIVLIGTVSFAGRLDNGKQHAILRVKSDENGKFSFDFDAEIIYLYHVAYRSENIKYLGGSHSINSGNKNKITLKAERAGFVKVNLINEAPKDTVKQLWINTVNSQTGEVDFYFEKRNFNRADSTLFIRNKKDSDYKLSWNIQNNADTIVGQQNYKVNAWDTIEFTIRY